MHGVVWCGMVWCGVVRTMYRVGRIGLMFHSISYDISQSVLKYSKIFFRLMTGVMSVSQK